MPATTKPMLAVAATVADIRPGYLMSPKLDGIRALHLGSAGLLTRSLKPIPNQAIRAIFAAADLHGLDGELIVGDPTAPDVFRRSTSGVMSVAGQPDATFHVFDDLTDPALPFAQRLTRLAARVADLQARGLPVQLVPQIAVDANNPASAIEERFLAQGYEGAIARHPARAYKYGRSTAKEAGMLKIKRFEDSEAIVIGCIEQMHNANSAATNALGHTERSTASAGLVPAGVLGALIARDLKTGIEFAIGTGFDAAARAELWTQRASLAGAICRYRHFPLGDYTKPRFPTFAGFRAAADL